MKILLNSLPKSGTNMVQKCLEQASVPYSGRSIAASSCFGRHALAKSILRRPSLNEVPLLIGLEIPVSVSPRWTSRYLKNASGYVSGHAAYSDHYHSILKAEGYKTIQVVRHPCAVLTSWANYIAESGYYWKNAHSHLAEMELPDRVRFLLNGGKVGKDISLYYKPFLAVLKQIEGWVDAEDVLTVRYEDLVGEKGGGSDKAQRETISKILQHIGRNYQNAELDILQSSLYGGTHTFRSGQIDGWKKHINDELNTLIVSELKVSPVVQKLGYSDFLK